MSDAKAIWWGVVAYKITLVVVGAVMSYLQSPWWALLVFLGLVVG